MVPSGKRLQKTMERSTMFNGQINYFDWAIFQFANCVFTRGYHSKLWFHVEKMFSLVIKNDFHIISTNKLDQMTLSTSSTAQGGGGSFKK